MEASIAIFLPKKWKIHKEWVYMEVATFCEGETQQGKSIKSIDKGKRNDFNKSGLSELKHDFSFFACNVFSKS